LRGTLSVDKLSYTGFETEEHLIFTVVTEDGTEVDEDIVNRFMELPATVIGDCEPETAELNEKRRTGIALRQAKIEEENKKYFLEECAKLDAYSEDLKEGLQRELKELGKEITEKKRIFKSSTDRPLAEMLDMKEEINRLEERHKKMRRELYEREDEIDSANERLQDEIRSKLAGTSKAEHIMTISFEIV
jgi:chromosome segregation ATPase